MNEPASFDEKEAVTTARKPLQVRKQWGYSVAAAKVSVQLNTAAHYLLALWAVLYAHSTVRQMPLGAPIGSITILQNGSTVR